MPHRRIGSRAKYKSNVISTRGTKSRLSGAWKQQTGESATPRVDLGICCCCFLEDDSTKESSSSLARRESSPLSTHTNQLEHTQTFSRDCFFFFFLRLRFWPPPDDLHVTPALGAVHHPLYCILPFHCKSWLVVCAHVDREREIETRATGTHVDGDEEVLEESCVHTTSFFLPSPLVSVRDSRPPLSFSMFIIHVISSWLRLLFPFSPLAARRRRQAMRPSFCSRAG